MINTIPDYIAIGQFFNSIQKIHSFYLLNMNEALFVCLLVCLFLQNISQLSPDGPLPQLPLPYINNSETRVFFGHDRRPAEGYCFFLTV